MKRIKLGKILDVKRGASLSGEYYAEDGELVRLTLGNFDYPGGGFKPNASKKDIYFTGAVKPEYILSKGDIITPLTEQVAGLLGETATIPVDGIYVQSGDVGLILPDESKVNRRYVYHLMPSKLVKTQLGAGAQQTKIRHTSPDAIKDCTVWIHDTLAEQKAVASLLDTIDAKIANNNAICTELEAMAKLLYDYWFVQFDFPDENGRPYKSSGGKMVWNDELKCEIPEGWEVNKIAELMNVVRGVSYQPSEASDAPFDNCVPLLKSNNLQDGKINYDCIYVPKNNATQEQYLDKGSVFITMSSGSTAHVGKTALVSYDTPYVFGAFCAKIKPMPEYRSFVSQFFLSDYFANKIRTIVVGTSIKNISVEHLGDNLIAVPAAKVLEDYEQRMSFMVEKLGLLEQSSLELASLRDFLLPLLMNGQVSVKG